MSELARMPRAARGALFRARRPSPHQRYMAFLSYSHDDEKDAAWLHENLEEFRVPKRLIGQLTDMGPVPKRLSPIFRDRHELAALLDAVEAGQVIDYGPMVTAPALPPVNAVKNRRAKAPGKLVRFVVMPILYAILAWHCGRAFIKALRQ